jgi:GntR family transcriptional regulator
MAAWEQLPELNRDDYKPLYIQLSDLFAEYIRKNNLAEGELLPSENELISHYGVSRSTVRQAMLHLENRAFIRKLRGKGTFVSGSRYRKCLRGLQSFEETLAEQGIVLSNTLLSFEPVPASAECAANLDLPEDSRVFLIRRLKVSNGEPLALEERVLPLEIGARLSEAELRDRPVFDLVERHAALEIVRVAYTITAAPLAAEEAQLLGAEPGAPALRRMGLYHDRSGRPVMSGSLVFLPEKTELQYEFEKSDTRWVVVPLGNAPGRTPP